MTNTSYDLYPFTLMTATITSTPKLTGQALIDHVDNGDLNGMSKTEQCLTAGYVRDNGKAAYTEFYTELLNAKGTLSIQTDGIGDAANWYDNLSVTEQELYDAIEERCPEFEKLSADDCDTFMSELEDIGITTASEFSDAYYGQQDGWHPEATFAEELMIDRGQVNEDSPVFFAIDWERVWDHSLSHDFSTIEFDGATYFFRNN
jgi:hypothetical protein